MTQALRKPPAQRRRQVPYGSFPFRWGPLQQIAHPRQIAAQGRATLLYYTNRKLFDDNEFRQETGGEIDHLILAIYYVHQRIYQFSRVFLHRWNPKKSKIDVSDKIERLFILIGRS